MNELVSICVYYQNGFFNTFDAVLFWTIGRQCLCLHFTVDSKYSNYIPMETILYFVEFPFKKK